VTRFSPQVAGERVVSGWSGPGEEFDRPPNR
jgi:hypothetical protein